jgi:hypothetical protein
VWSVDLWGGLHDLCLQRLRLRVDGAILRTTLPVQRLWTRRHACDGGLWTICLRSRQPDLRLQRLGLVGDWHFLPLAEARLELREAWWARIRYNCRNGEVGVRRRGGRANRA